MMWLNNVITYTAVVLNTIINYRTLRSDFCRASKKHSLPAYRLEDEGGHKNEGGHEDETRNGKVN